MIPTIGANGFLMRRQELLDNFEETIFLTLMFFGSCSKRIRNFVWQRLRPE